MFIIARVNTVMLLLVNMWICGQTPPGVMLILEDESLGGRSRPLGYRLPPFDQTHDYIRDRALTPAGGLRMAVHVVMDQDVLL